MRRFLNLNQLSMMFVKMIGLFGVILPAVLYGFSLLGSGMENLRTFLRSLMQISFLLGGSVFLVFLILIVIEQIQDHHFDTQYRKQRNQKILLSSGYYECQYCGNQRVGANDKTCEVCGKEFAL